MRKLFFKSILLILPFAIILSLVEYKLRQTPNSYQKSKTDLEKGLNEFEILVTKILQALGFEAEHTGKVADGGVDATGTLDVSGLAKIRIFVQVKRYENRAIDANTVKSLRSNIPQGGQGAFITTSDFQKKAYEIATKMVSQELV